MKLSVAVHTEHPDASIERLARIFWRIFGINALAAIDKWKDPLEDFSFRNDRRDIPIYVVLVGKLRGLDLRNNFVKPRNAIAHFGALLWIGTRYHKKVRLLEPRWCEERSKIFTLGIREGFLICSKIEGDMGLRPGQRQEVPAIAWIDAQERKADGFSFADARLFLLADLLDLANQCANGRWTERMHDDRTDVVVVEIDLLFGCIQPFLELPIVQQMSLEFFDGHTATQRQRYESRTD